MNSTEQQFFTDLEKKLWTAADKLRSNLDAAVYKHGGSPLSQPHAANVRLCRR